MNLGRRNRVPEFALLSHHQDPRPFGASFILQIAILMFLAVMPRFVEVQVQQAPHKQYVFTPLTGYKVAPVRMDAVSAPKIKLETPKVVMVAKLTTPPEFRREQKIEEVKPVEVKSAHFDLAPAAVPIPKQPKIVRTGLLEGSSAQPSLKMPAQK